MFTRRFAVTGEGSARARGEGPKKGQGRLKSALPEKGFNRNEVPYACGQSALDDALSGWALPRCAPLG
ncbi:MAG: hypothetical protein COT06_10510 [Syntrophobacteraceae bacterium CG07_land_8_20_14_0_80_61_8]|nr:MAG: hypothetical protein COT06_10510 [Syntrophobacteraceae bacterium CG07_land_8_20_14_0_80_61_8]